MAIKKFSNLKGIRLYNALVKQLGDANKKAKSKQILSISQRRKIVSEKLYPKFKATPKLLNKDVNSEIKEIIKGLAPSQICNPLYLAEAYLSLIEYYEIDNHIRGLLPECLDVRVNAGIYGRTKIFNTSNYDYYDNGVQDIIENIREVVTDLTGKNLSGVAYFSGIVKVKPKRKNDGNGDSYYVDYVLYLNDVPVTNDEGTNFDLGKKEVKKVEKVRDYLAERMSNLVKEKKKKSRLAKKKKEQAKKLEPKEQKKSDNEAIQKAIASFKLLLQKKILTKAEFEKLKSDLVKKKKK
jgi:transposase